MKAADVVTAVRRHYRCEHDGFGPEWAALDEMAMRPGVAASRIDLLCIRAWAGKPKGHERHAIEVKVSRSDLKRELDKGKWRPWADVTHRFYLAVPHTMKLDGFELPDEWGVLRVSEHGGAQCHRRAPRRDEPEPLPEPVTVEAFRRASRGEARIRQADDDDPQAQIEQQRQRIESLNRKVETSLAAEERWKGRAADALELFAQTAPDVYCRCGTRLRLADRPWKRFRGPQWEHDGEPGVDPMPAYSSTERACRWPGPDHERLADAVQTARAA